MGIWEKRRNVRNGENLGKNFLAKRSPFVISGLKDQPSRARFSGSSRSSGTAWTKEAERARVRFDDKRKGHPTQGVRGARDKRGAKKIARPRGPGDQ
jgi:hypothetical protein